MLAEEEMEEIAQMDGVVGRRDGGGEGARKGVWRLGCGAMLGWFTRSQVAGGPKDADCCCCLLKVLSA